MSLITFVAKTKVAAADVNSNFTDVKQITVRNEDLSPMCNGMLTQFPTAFVYQPNSLAVYFRDTTPAVLKTERLIKGTDYTEDVGYNTFTIITFTPQTGDKLIIDYTKDI